MQVVSPSVDPPVDQRVDQEQDQMCSCPFCMSTALNVAEEQPIMLPVAIRMACNCKENKKSVVAYLTHIEGKYQTIIFGDGTVYDNLTKAAKEANTKYLNKNLYEMNGWRSWCIKYRDDVFVRLSHVKQRLVNSSSHMTNIHLFDTYCTQEYNIGERNALKKIYNINPTINDVDNLIQNLDVDKAKQLWAMKYFPILHNLGDIRGTEQECTISWKGTFLNEVLFPRSFLEMHPQYAELARKPKKQACAMECHNGVLSYFDRILEGDYFPILRVNDHSGPEWEIVIKGDHGEESKLWVPIGILGGSKKYYEWYNDYCTRVELRS